MKSLIDNHLGLFLYLLLGDDNNAKETTEDHVNIQGVLN